MQQYLDLCQYILDHGQKREDRTGTGTISTFGYQMRFNLEEGFPLLTTKKVFYRGIFEELLWFLSGETNIKPLVDKNVKIWNEWPYEAYKKLPEYNNETMEEFIEKIRTDDYTSNLSLALIGAVSQDESHSISKNVAMGYHERFARGEYNFGNNRILGYDCVDGKLVPNADAWIIREIFERFNAGESYGGIARALNEKGARTLKGGDFSLQAVRYIIKNETYVGDKHLQKRQPLDYITHKPDPTNIIPDYYLTDDHEGIVGRDAWNAAQERAKAVRDNENNRQYCYREYHPFYGKIICGECGTPFKRRTLRAKSGDHYKAWNCGERQKGKNGNGCKARVVKEDDLMEEILEQLGWDEMDDERFEETVSQVLVFDDRVEVEMKANSRNTDQDDGLRK